MPVFQMHKLAHVTLQPKKRKTPYGKKNVLDVKYKRVYATTLLCHIKWKSSKRQPCFLFVPFACLPTLTFK